jgi:hypothetical protein
MSGRWLRSHCISNHFVCKGHDPYSLSSIIPETKGRSLEEMDIVFGAVSAVDRAANIARHEQGAYLS